MFGYIAGYAIKKVVKIAAVIVGLFIAALAYLQYQKIISVDWNTLQNLMRSGAQYLYENGMNAVNQASANMQSNTLVIVGMPVVAFAGGFLYGLSRG